jgi:hypothetical protein
MIHGGAIPHNPQHRKVKTMYKLRVNSYKGEEHAIKTLSRYITGEDRMISVGAIAMDCAMFGNGNFPDMEGASFFLKEDAQRAADRINNVIRHAVREDGFIYATIE